ncbi:MAG: PorV/PorQ family protein [Acidobacteriota bacterium]
MRRILFCVMALLPAVLCAQYDRPGSTDAQFLKIGVSPRGTGMGDAYIASVEGAEATFYNSAALAWKKGTDLVFNHTRWFAGINHEFAAASMDIGSFGAVGVSVTALYTDEMNVTTPLQPEGTGETFYAGNYRLGLTYSRFLTDRVSIGITGSVLRMTLYKGYSADAAAIDIAAQYVSDFRGFRFAMQIVNFGSNIQYVNESYPLPTSFVFGFSMNALEFDDHTLLASFAASKPNEGRPQAQVGLEWRFRRMFFARGGYRINHSVADYTFGGGVAAPVMGTELRVDYSYSNFLLLGAVHRIGFGLSI